MAQQQGCHSGDLLISSQFPRPPFQGGDQGLRAFHRRTAALLANSGPASEDALLTLRTVLFRLHSPEKVYRC